MDSVPETDAYNRATAGSVPASRMQPVREASAAPSALKGSEALNASATVAAEKVETGTEAPDDVAPTCTDPAVDVHANRKGDSAAALPDAERTGPFEPSKPLQQEGHSEQPKVKSGEPVTNGRSEPQASTGVVCHPP